jgi:dolichol-phosphate mannosyltransferase
MTNATRVAIVVPTYNERDNIAALLAAALAASDKVDALVIDDNSPDGTGRIVDQLAAANPRISIVHRTERGRGTAGRDGFLECLKRGYGFIMEMDADFSHDPADIPRFIAAIADADLVIGSRGVAGGSEEGRSRMRMLITAFAGTYMRWLLGVPRVRDCTSGYRCFRREALEQANVATLKSRGPSIVTEMLFRCRKLRIKEIPIRFRDRRAGNSKFNLKAMTDSLILPLRIRLGL